MLHFFLAATAWVLQVSMEVFRCCILHHCDSAVFASSQQNGDNTHSVHLQLHFLCAL